MNPLPRRKTRNEDWTKWDQVMSDTQIRHAVTSVARRLEALIQPDEPITIVCVLQAAIRFTSDLMGVFYQQHSKRKAGEVELAYLRVRRTVDADGSRRVDINDSMLEWSTIRHHTVIIVDALSTTGETLFRTAELMQANGADRILAATLLKKFPSRNDYSSAIQNEFDCHQLKRFVRNGYVWGQEIPQQAVVGYGIDYCEKYRLLRDIRALPPELQGMQIKRAIPDGMMPQRNP